MQLDFFSVKFLLQRIIVVGVLFFIPHFDVGSIVCHAVARVCQFNGDLGAHVWFSIPYVYSVRIGKPVNSYQVVF